MRRFVLLCVALPLALLAGCSPKAPPVVSPVTTATPVPMQAKYVRVIDSTGPADIAAMKRAHVVGFVGYIAGGGSWKHMTPSQARAYRKSGIAVGYCWEGGATSLAGGYGAGVAAAKSCVPALKACGAPADTPVYFACDFDAGAHDPTAFLKGAVSVLGYDRVGLYAGYTPIRYNLTSETAHWVGTAEATPTPAAELAFSAAAHTCRYHWQTKAWSVGRVAPGIDLYQLIGHPWGNLGSDYDADEAFTADWGQERSGATPKPRPTPKARMLRATKRMAARWAASLHAKKRYLVVKGDRLSWGGVTVNGWDKVRKHGRTGWYPKGYTR